MLFQKIIIYVILTGMFQKIVIYVILTGKEYEVALNFYHGPCIHIAS